jgi:hypothetical protein
MGLGARMSPPDSNQRPTRHDDERNNHCDFHTDSPWPDLVCRTARPVVPVPVLPFLLWSDAPTVDAVG